MSDLRERISSYFSDRKPAVVSAYLFGSHARGSAHVDSDIDVAVLFDRSAAPERRRRSELAIRLSSDLIAVTHCNRVDVVALNDATPELAQRIFDEGKRLFCIDEDSDRRFRLMTRLRYIDMIPFLRRNRAIKLEVLRS